MINWDKIVKDHGCSTRKELLAKLYAKHGSLRIVAEKLDMSRGTVNKIMMEEGIPRKGVGGSNYHGDPKSFLGRIRKLSKEFCESHSIEEIIRSLGQFPSDIRRWRVKSELTQQGFNVYYENKAPEYVPYKRVYHGND